MPTYQDEAVVLRTQRLGEADRIITLLTREHGQVRAVAKGVRRTSSKFGARLEPFMVVHAQLWAGRTLDTVTQAVSLAHYGAEIAGDFDRYTAASAAVETAQRLTSADPAPQQYLLLIGVLRAIANGDRDPQRLLDSYLLRALSLGGWSPALSSCARCGREGPLTRFSAPRGGAVCAACGAGGAPRIDDGVLAAMRDLVAGDWQAVDATAEGDARRASGLIAAYAQFHLERGLKSLDVFDRQASLTRETDQTSTERTHRAGH